MSANCSTARFSSTAAFVTWETLISAISATSLERIVLIKSTCWSRTERLEAGLFPGGIIPASTTRVLERSPSFDHSNGPKSHPM